MTFQISSRPHIDRLPPLTALMPYLAYLIGLPKTRKNESLIDCTIHLMQELPDTEDSLHARD